jgi:23S rRNA (pseudouridine1915-N3)-methyltransferase
MQIYLITVGNRMPEWIKAGYEEYSKRMPRECELVLKEIPPGTRTKNPDLVKTLKEEGERINTVIPAGSHIIALDVSGKNWSTPELALNLRRWLDSGKNISLLIGGPDGIAEQVRNRAGEFWSLSALTFPHPLVRVIVAEQLYRAWSILQNHPYHR